MPADDAIIIVVAGEELETEDDVEEDGDGLVELSGCGATNLPQYGAIRGVTFISTIAAAERKVWN